MTQSVANGSETTITLDTTVFVQGTTAQHRRSSNTGPLTCQVDDLCLISGTVVFANNGTEQRSFHLRINGTTYPASWQQQAASGSDMIATVSTFYPLHVGDYVEMRVYQT